MYGNVWAMYGSCMDYVWAIVDKSNYPNFLAKCKGNVWTFV